MPLEEQNKIISIAENFVTLTDDSPAGETTRMRAKEFTSKSGVLKTNKYHPHNRLARCLIYGKNYDVKFKDNTDMIKELSENPLKYKMVIESQTPKLNSRRKHGVYVSHACYKDNPTSTWIITLVKPVAYKIRGTYTSKDTSTLIFIGLIFCAENVCAQTPTKIFLPDENLVNTINKYQILTKTEA